MSWETVEQWPGQGQRKDAPFRGTSQPVIAQRDGLSFIERMRLFWASTPEHPYRDSVKRMVMTPSFLYVETVSGDKRRVSLGALIGGRVEGRFHTYGVHQGQDVRVLHRPDCRVEAALSERLSERSAEPWGQRGTFYAFGLVVFFVLLLATVFFYAEHPWPSVQAYIQEGRWTAETIRGGLSWMITGLLSVLMFLLGPSSLRIDALGVSQWRGVIPLFRFNAPREAVDAIVVRQFHEQRLEKDQVYNSFGYELRLCWHVARRTGGLGGKSEYVLLERAVYTPQASDPSQSRQGTLERMLALAHRLAALLQVDVEGPHSARQPADPDSYPQSVRDTHRALRQWRWVQRAVVLAAGLLAARVTDGVLFGLEVREMLSLSLGFSYAVMTLFVPGVVGYASLRLCRRLHQHFLRHEEDDFMRVNLRTATVAQLEYLPLIGPWRANAILQYRAETGFQSVDDLVNVPVVGDAVLRRIRRYVTLDEETVLPHRDSRQVLLHYAFRSLIRGGFVLAVLIGMLSGILGDWTAFLVFAAYAAIVLLVQSYLVDQVPPPTPVLRAFHARLVSGVVFLAATLLPNVLWMGRLLLES